MGFLSGISGGLQAALSDPNMMRLIAQQSAKSPQGGGGGGRRGGGFLGRLRGAFSPENIAMLQATLSNDPAALAQIAALHQRQQEEAGQHDRERQEWLFRQKFENENRPPRDEGDFVEAMRGAGIDPASPEGQTLYRQRATSMANPFMGVPNGDGTVSYFPRVPAQQGAAQGGNLPRPQSEAEVQALPPGTQFIAPDGTVRTTPGGAGSQAQPPFSGNALDAATVQGESSGRRYNRSGSLLRGPVTRSGERAMGEWQVMPSTARDPGFGIRPWNGRDNDDLARVGRDYRSAMERRYGGDLRQMWAAYNWGPGNLDNALARHGSDWLRHAPQQTQDYIARNLRAVGRR